MIHYVFFALEALLAVVVIIWGVREFRRMKRKNVKESNGE